MQNIYLTCIHDRHTDDKFKAFATEQAAKDFLREMQIKYRWTEAQENMQHGDWCLFITDDYYMSVEKIELVAEKVA